MTKKIGIPKALLYYKYYPFWKAFLEGLRCEVVTSNVTTKKILQDGIKHTVDESCLSVKVFCGHVLDLVEKGVDYLFIPRIESVEKDYFVCTKFYGLPDIIRNNIENIPPILDLDIDINRKSLYQAMFAVGWKLSKNPLRIHTAYCQAKKKQHRFKEMLSLTKTPQEVIELIDTCQIKRLKGKENLTTDKNFNVQTHQSSKKALKIALIGHPYNIYDDFVNFGIIKELQALGINVLTSEMVPHEVSFRLASQLSPDLYWTYGKEILGSSLYFLNKGVNGIIFITSFPCGPDSLIIEYTIRKIKNQLPTLTLVIDEHQAEAGIITRVESFVDLIKRRQRK
jgi:predicted nucleotide-binding protein (sugar kinase/HSP70/actin superfamily)